ncbi:hypothetical protein ABW19_dt0202398 [Dactylella cylindrospora]|nr:hypothetical protein ABW19_dt0202398 [Dactylella cylindrospora]
MTLDDLSNDGSPLSGGSRYEHDGPWKIDDGPVFDYKAIHDDCIPRGVSRLADLEAAIKANTADVNPTPILMEAPSTDYKLEVQTDPAEMEKAFDYINRHYGLKVTLEDLYLRRHPTFQWTESNEDLQILADDYRLWSVDNPENPHDGIFDRAYVGLVSQKDRTLVVYRRYKDQDRATNKSWPSDVTFSVWTHLATRRFIDGQEPLQVYDLDYIVMNDVVNRETVARWEKLASSYGGTKRRFVGENAPRPPRRVQK